MLHLSFRCSLRGSSLTAPKLDQELMAAWLHKLFQYLMPHIILHLHVDVMHCWAFEDNLHRTLNRTDRISQMPLLLRDLERCWNILALPFRRHAGLYILLVHCEVCFTAIALAPLFSAWRCSYQTLLDCRLPRSWFRML